MTAPLDDVRSKRIDSLKARLETLGAQDDPDADSALDEFETLLEAWDSAREVTSAGSRLDMAVTGDGPGRPHKVFGVTSEAQAVAASTVEDGLRSAAFKVAALLPETARAEAIQEARSLPLSSLAVRLPELIAGLGDPRSWSRSGTRTGQRTGRLTSHVVAQVSREIRDPLSGIVEALRQLAGTDLGYDQRRLLDEAGLSAAAMQHLVNDLLDLSSLQAGTYAPERLPFGLRDCVAATLAQQLPRAQELQVQVTDHCAADVPDQLIGDPGRLRQVLGTLVGNALVYARGGQVQASCQIEGDDPAADPLTLRFTIQSRGSPGELRSLVTESGSVWRGGGATGLGLSISRRLVEHMGGRTWVESGEDGSSHLHFTLRVVRGPARGRRPESIRGIDVRDMSLLVVDAAPESAPELMDRLRQMGTRPRLVRTADEARELLEQAALEGELPRFLLLCASLGNRRSVAMAEAIGSLPTELRPPIVLLTPVGQRGDSSRARRLGISAYLTLPLDTQDLQDALDVLSDPETAASLRQETLVTRHFLREARTLAPVLSVAQGADHQQWLADEIGATGHRVEVADLEGALAQADRGMQPPAFLVVYFDGGADGPRMRALISRLAERAARPGVIGLFDPELALAADSGSECADVRLEVPLEVDELRAAIKQMTRARLAAGSWGAALTRQPLVDRRELGRRLGDDRALEEEVVALIQRDAAPMMRKVRAAALLQDGDEVVRAAHVMQGALAVFGVRAADDLCGRIARAARRRAHGEAIRWLNQLEAVVATMLSELSSPRKDNLR